MLIFVFCALSHGTLTLAVLFGVSSLIPAGIVYAGTTFFVQEFSPASSKQSLRALSRIVSKLTAAVFALGILFVLYCDKTSCSSRSFWWVLATLLAQCVFLSQA